MPILVKLLDLVSVPDTRHLWPAEFDAFVTEMENKPTSRSAFGPCADWLEDDDRDEAELARAFRYLDARHQVRLQKSGSWFMNGLPHVVTNTPLPPHRDQATLAGAVALLYHRLVAAEDKLRKDKEDLT